METATQQQATRTTADLDRHLVRGLAWTSAVKWGGQLAAWASTIVVARLLTPFDYGIIGMATIYLALVALISEFGVGTAIVSLEEWTDHQIRQLNTVALLVGIAGVIVSCAAAIPVARFFGNRQVALVLVVMSSSFFISSFQTVPGALLQRQLRFKLLAGLEGVKTLLTATSTVILAFWGAGYWTLVFGGIIGSFVATILTIYIKPVRFSIPKFPDIRSALRFSSDILISRFGWYAFSNADFMVAGKVLGANALGTYTLAWSIASMPVEKITTLFARVGPAFFSAVQKDNAAMKRYLLGLTEPLAIATFPVTVGIALVADDLVHIAFGSKWDAAILPMRILMLAMSVRCLTPLLPFVLNVKGLTRFNMWNTVSCAAVLPVGFYIGSRWAGTAGIAVVWMSIYPLFMIPLFFKVFEVIDCAPKEYIRVIWPAGSSAVLMGLLVFLTSKLLGPGHSAVTTLIVKVAVGAAAYTGLMFFVHRTSTNRLLTFVKNFRQGRA